MDTLLAEAGARGWQTVPLLGKVAGLCRDQPTAALETLLTVKELYEALCRRRRSVFEDRKVLAIHARTEPYREIRSRFSAVIDDYDDCEVILGAHHVAATVDGMVLYTGDHRHIIANRDLILSETCPTIVRYQVVLTVEDEPLVLVPEAMVREPELEKPSGFEAGHRSSIYRQGGDQET